MIRFCGMSLRSLLNLIRHFSETRLKRLYWICSSVLIGSIISGCVTPMTMEEQSPDLDYLHENSIVISVIDARVSAQRATPETHIGSAQDAFDKVISLETYPWFVSNEEKRKQALSDALAERIVFGLNDEGWDAIPANFSDMPSSRETESILQSQNAENLLVLTLKKWNVSLNLNWITALIFDWDIAVTIINKSGKKLAEFTDSGTDIIDEESGRSFADHIRLAYRQRLISILEDEKIRMALRIERDEPKVADDDPELAGDDPEQAGHDPVLAFDGLEAATDEPNVDSKSYLIGQLKMLQLLLENGTISQQEFTDLVRRVVDDAANTLVE